MEDIYTTFFQHSSSVGGFLVDVTIYFGMIYLVCYIIRFMTSLGRRR